LDFIKPKVVSGYCSSLEGSGHVNYGLQDEMEMASPAIVLTLFGARGHRALTDPEYRT
jgi:hypothetical protein